MLHRALPIGMTLAVALTAATHADVLVTEIMYDPAGGNEHEYIELYNTGSTPVDLTGYTLSDDPGQTTPNTFTLPSGSIAPGGTAVLIRIDGSRTLANFQNAWGNDINFIQISPWPNYTNAGDVVQLQDDGGTVIASVNYRTSNGYPAIPNTGNDGGPSIYMLDVDAADPYAANNWAVSIAGVDGAHVGASPRTLDIGSPGFVAVPEPASVAVVGLALLGLLARRRDRASA